MIPDVFVIAAAALSLLACFAIWPLLQGSAPLSAADRKFAQSHRIDLWDDTTTFPASVGAGTARLRADVGKAPLAGSAAPLPRVDVEPRSASTPPWPRRVDAEDLAGRDAVPPGRVSTGPAH